MPDMIRRSNIRSRVGSVGAVVTTPKNPSDPTRAEWWMQHKGPGGAFWAGIGIFPHGTIQHANPSDPGFGEDVWLGGVVTIPRQSDFADIKLTAEGSWPVNFTSGSYDVLKIITPEGNDPISRRIRGDSPIYQQLPGLDDDWDDSVYVAAPPIFRFIEDSAHPVVYS